MNVFKSVLDLPVPESVGSFTENSKEIEKRDTTSNLWKVKAEVTKTCYELTLFLE
jgi:hypothetical protein